MQLVKLSVVVLLVGAFVSSCNDNIDEVLVGTWNVTRVEGTFNTGSGSMPPVADESPTGTITFKRNGSGNQNYTYSIGGTDYPQTGSFSWSATDDLIIIERTTEPDMEWSRLVDTENRQVATYNVLINATQSWDYTLTLEK
jgi:hypothetical protein